MEKKKSIMFSALLLSLSLVGCGTASGNNQSTSDQFLYKSTAGSTSANAITNSTNPNASAANDATKDSSGQQNQLNNQTEQSQTTNQNQDANAQTSGNNGSSSQGQNSGNPAPYSLSGKYTLVSKLYSVQGTITAINKTENKLQSITLKITKNNMGADSSVDDPNYPFKLGSTQEFKFEETLANADTFHSKVGDEVDLQVGQFQTQSSNSLVWGSNSKWISSPK